MPDYGKILEFLAKNPPQFEAEKKLHASLLELLAHCLRSDEQISGEPGSESLEEHFSKSHNNWVHFN